MKTAGMFVACGLLGFVAACGGGSGSKHHFRPTTLQKVQPPQPTTSTRVGAK